MVSRRILLGSLAVAAVIATGCSDDAPAGDSSLPDAASLLRDSAAASQDITSAHFTLKADGEIEGFSVHSAEGDLTREGAAKGTINMDLLGQLFEGEFVLVDDNIYIKGATGDYQKLPASLIADLYDPSAILDPERGIAKVLTSVQNPKTEARESVDGTSAYKVSGRVTEDTVKSLVPGVNSDVDITLWLREDNQQPAKAAVRLPGGSVEVSLSNVDQPVSITAPV